MKLKPFFLRSLGLNNLKRSSSALSHPLMAQSPIQTRTSHDSNPPEQPHDNLCSNQQQEEEEEHDDLRPSCLEYPGLSLRGESRVEYAWAYWAKLGRPRFIVAPMVDNSELPFRMLCRKYGATAAYTPMLHSRIFNETEKYRKEEFTTCKVKH